MKSLILTVSLILSTSLLSMLTSYAKEVIPLKKESILATNGYANCLIYFDRELTAKEQQAFSSELYKSLSNFKKIENKAEGLNSLVITKYFANIKQNFPIPARQNLRYYIKGLEQNEIEKLINSKTCFSINALLNKATLFADYRQFCETIQSIAQKHQVLIWDSDTRTCYSASSWKNILLDTWDYPKEKIPFLNRHFKIHAFRKNEHSPLCRAVSLGLGKFGLPEITIEDFNWSEANNVQNLICGVAQELRTNPLVPDPNRYSFAADSISHPKMKAYLAETLSKNARPVLLTLKAVSPQSGDNSGHQISIGFDNARNSNGKSLQIKQQRVLSDAFGYIDDIARVEHDKELEAESAKAKAQLPLIKERFNKGLPLGSYLLLKAPFETDTEGREWMWVDVTQWKGDNIDGVLKNAPRDIKRLSAGSKVTIKQADVFDYYLVHSKKPAEGNKTGEIIRRHLKKRQN